MVRTVTGSRGAAPGRAAAALRAALLGAVLLGSAGSACSAPRVAGGASGSGDVIGVDAAQLPLNPEDPSQSGIGDFRYAGGLHLTSRETGRLHGLSDVDVTDTDRLVAVGDLGVLFDARLVLDESARLTGVADAHIAQLTGEDGGPLSDKEDADAEGLALLPNGDRLVTFERRHRIWLYPSTGGPPHAVPMPGGAFPPNSGLEAVAADPEAGGDAYIVGAETSGETWTCRVSAPCVPSRSVDKPAESGLVAVRRLPDRRTAYLFRAFDETRGAAISLQIHGDGGLVARMDLAPPMTIDNFEGLAAVPLPTGEIRFYLLSDDNARDTERTLLLAFDWWPPEVPR